MLALHTVDEFRMFTIMGGSPTVETEEDLAALGRAFGLSAARLAEFRSAAPGAPVAEVYAMLGTDYLFAEYTSRLAEARGRAGAETYLARFAWQSPALGGVLGACHGTDLPFSWGDLTNGPAAQLVFGGTAPTIADEDLARRMLASWVAFAQGKNPGWPRPPSTRTPVMRWDIAEELIEESASPRRAAWSDVTFEARRR
ncbi:MAG TPA: hypothetical protein VMV92_33795 [Streptosporangiaceae bacterium]|nr:hypothetical protein [Streptosporangiaceae bacterium]